MSNKQSGVIEAVSNKTVKTKWGDKPTYSFKVDGEWYGNGFSVVPSKGTAVEFEWEDTQYGRKTVKGTLQRTDGGTSPSTGSGGSNGKNLGKSVSSGKGVFPIPVDDGQRSIIRQNAVTNANALILNYYGPKFYEEFDSFEDAQRALIETARYIETYTTGDADKAAAVQKATAMIKERAWKETIELSAGIHPDGRDEDMFSFDPNE